MGMILLRKYRFYLIQLYELHGRHKRYSYLLEGVLVADGDGWKAHFGQIIHLHVHVFRVGQIKCDSSVDVVSKQSQH